MKKIAEIDSKDDPELKEAIAKAIDELKKLEGAEFSLDLRKVRAKVFEKADGNFRIRMAVEFDIEGLDEMKGLLPKEE